MRAWWVLLVACFCSHSLCQQQQQDYGEVLRLSLLFYEAQRSGKLPENNRVPWRGDSALYDRGQEGEDLSGGYYDAGDFVKFGFTMASTTTLLAWGCLSYKDAYVDADMTKWPRHEQIYERQESSWKLVAYSRKKHQRPPTLEEIGKRIKDSFNPSPKKFTLRAGEWSHALEALKWATDYFIKCHISPYELYGQVGDFSLDHTYWGRPEELNMSRPAYKIDMRKPGSDLAGETAAALAATSIVFRTEDPDYAEELFDHAKQLYDFANKYRGLYNDAIKGASEFYESTDYGDELTWAAAWLYRASKAMYFLDEAEHHYMQFRLRERPNEFFYNKKVAGVQVMLAQITKRSEYVEAAKAFCNFTVDSQKRTPKGLVYIDKSGTLCHAANVAFLCLQVADEGINAAKYRWFAQEQIGYMLGDSGRSFVVGYGENFPTQPHHSASSCPDIPEICNWSNLKSPEANPQVLLGALVSGPDENDFYKDKREEFIYNEVTLDYNAGFQSAVAGLLHLRIRNLTVTTKPPS